LFDPQTSGGLLLGIGPERAEGLCNALRELGYADTAIIGEVDKRSAGGHFLEIGA